MRSKTKTGLLAILDIGTSKIVCLIAKLAYDGSLRIEGIGHQSSRGLRAGMISDLKAAESAILSAVDAAEKMASETIDSVIVNLSGNHVRSEHVQHELSIGSHEITAKDIDKLLSSGYVKAQREGREIIHCIPIEYRLDDGVLVDDPMGMYAQTLHVKLHVVTGLSTSMLTISHCLARCHLHVADFIASSYASALACIEEENQLGVTLIDMGGGTTSIASFQGGRLVYLSSLPVGGQHVTSDVACGLSIPLDAAERLKTLQGTLIRSVSDVNDMLEIYGAEEDHEAKLISRHALIDIISPRIEETFELVKKRLDATHPPVGHILLLTGGASQLLGIKDVAASILGSKVRFVNPCYIDGMAESMKGGAFATSSGLVKYAVSRVQEARPTEKEQDVRPLPKILAWVKENF